MNSPQHDDGMMGKNFWLALILSALVIFGYPFFIKWITPPAQTVPSEEQTEEADATVDEVSSQAKEVLKRAEGPFLEKPTPPTLIHFENAIYNIDFSTLGASLTRLWYKGEAIQNMDSHTVFYDGEAANPGIFAVRFLNDKEDLSRKIFKLTQRDDSRGLLEFTYEKPGEYRVIKQFFVSSEESLIRCGIKIENLTESERFFPIEINYALQTDSLDDPMNQQHAGIVVVSDKVESANLGKLAKKKYELSKSILWAGAVKKYFTVLLKPEWKAVANTGHAEGAVILGALTMDPLAVAGRQSEQKEFLIYAGPQRYESLKQLDYGFESILSRGFFGQFKIWLLLSLKFLNQYTHNYGFAIILLTLVIKGLFAPLTHISYKNMKKMQALQPKIKALQEHHKKNPEKLNREMMELFRRNKANPMAGCLPMLIQMPVLFAMFRVLPEAIELKSAPFVFWIHDLSIPDRFLMLPFTVPILGWDALNILPILMTLSQFWYQKIMPQPGTSPEQAKIMMLMPVFFGVICYNMPSGLVLYWCVQNLLSIIQQVFINRIVIVLHHEDRT